VRDLWHVCPCMQAAAALKHPPQHTQPGPLLRPTRPCLQCFGACGWRVLGYPSWLEVAASYGFPVQEQGTSGVRFLTSVLEVVAEGPLPEAEVPLEATCAAAANGPPGATAS
jgi:hypothetical protein